MRNPEPGLVAAFSVRDLLAQLWQRRGSLSSISVASYATLALTSIVQVAIARILGAEQFGVYAVALAFVALIEVPLITRGSELSLRKLGEMRNQGDSRDLRALARQLVRHDIALYVPAYLALACLSWIFRFKLGSAPWLIGTLALVIPAQAGYGVFKSYFIVFGKVKEMVRYELRLAVLQLALNLAGMLLWGLAGLAISVVVVAVVKNLLAYWTTRSYPPASTSRPSGETLGSLTRASALPMARNLFANGFLQIDIVLLGLLQKPETLALYKVGKSLASLPIKVSFPVWRYLQPKLVETTQRGEKGKQLQVILSGSVTLTIVMALLLPVVLLFGERALTLLYGDEYRGSFRYFLVLFIGVWVFHGVTGWFKSWAVVTKSQLYGTAVYATAFAAVATLGVVFGRISATAMSYVVTGVYITMSIVVFANVIRACRSVPVASIADEV